MAHKTVEQLGKEIESFQDEIRKLQQELSEMSRFVPEIGKHLHEKSKRIKEVFGGIKSQAQEKASAVYGAVKHGSTSAVDKSRIEIEKKPIASVLIAFTAGLLLSRFFGRMR